MVAVVRTLQRALPSAVITWITSTEAFQLLKGLEGVDFIVIDKPANLRDYINFAKCYRHRQFDVLIAAQANLRANLLYPLIRAPVKIGFGWRRSRDGQWLVTNHHVPARPRQHLVDRFLALLEPLGIQKQQVNWSLPISENDRQWAQQQLAGIDTPIIAVNPSASRQEKTWLAERYVSVIQAAQKRWGAYIVLTGGTAAAERELGDYILGHIPNGIRNLIGSTSLKQLAALLEQVDCLIAPDTGPAHVAVAVNTPVIGLWAIKPAWHSGPYCSELTVDRYAQAVRRLLGRDPNRIRWEIRIRKGNPMAFIQVEDVLEKLAEFMATLQR